MTGEDEARPEGADDRRGSSEGERDGFTSLRESRPERRVPGWVLLPLGAAAGGFVAGWAGAVIGAVLGFLVWRSRAGGLLLLGALALLPAGCGDAGPEGGPADLVFTGGDVVVLDAERLVVEAAAVRDGRIVYLGDEAGLDAHRGPGTREVDLDGRALTPAFVDHHTHLFNVGMSLLNEAEGGRLFIDMAGLSPEAVRDSLSRRAAELPEGTWIRGKSFTLDWPGGYYPTHESLDPDTRDHPVFLTRSGHIGVLNRAGMEAVGLDASTGEIPGGDIVRGPDGAPTGMLLERAVEAALPHIPRPDDGEVTRAFRLAADRLAAQGLTEVFDAGFLAFPAVADMSADFGRMVRLLAEADRSEPLPIRINLMIPGPSAFQDTVLANPDRWRELSPNVRVTHVKMFTDGTMYCQTAALSHPFLGAASDHRIFRTSEADLRDRASRALDAGLDVAVHAIGDAGVTRILDVFEELLDRRSGLDPGRLRIEHYTYASRSDFERARELGVVLSIQPHWGPPAGEISGDPRIPQDRRELISAWRTLSDMGARLASGTDNFAEPVHPLELFRAAAAKRVALSDRTGSSSRTGDDSEAAGRRAAALAFATALYPPGGGPPTRGGLGEGAPADLVVLSASPLADDAEELEALSVEATLRGGRVTFHGGGVAGLGRADAEAPR